MPFEHQVPLRPDGAGINRVLSLDQRHDDAILSLKYLPYVRGPATPFREIARVNDKGRSVFLPIAGRDDLMARDEEENVPASQPSFLPNQFDRVISRSAPHPLLQMRIDGVR